MKILLLCHKIPYPLHDGGAYSIFHTAMGLNLRGADVKVLAINTPKNKNDAFNIPADFRDRTRLETSGVDTRLKPFKAFINLFTSRSYFVERFFSQDYNNDLIRIIKSEAFDIVQLEHVYMCLYLDTIRKYSNSKVILRPQNVENKVWKSVLKNKIHPIKKIYLSIAITRLLKFEIQMANKVDGIIAISQDDNATFQLYAPNTPIVTVPIGFDFRKISDDNYYRQFTQFPVFYHLGSMDWLPNVQGIKWFIEDVMPYIRNTYPEFVFRIAGKKMPEWFYQHQNSHLIVDGEVKESINYHKDKSVMVVPLLSGGGLRAKIIEAMALGKAVISTTVGAEGIPYTDQENILIANTREEFAIQINKCKSSREFCQRIGRNAHLLALKHYDFNNTAESMIRFYHTVPVKLQVG